jgi:hypothetical protein
MTKDELFEYLSKKYDLDYILGPITGADYLCFKDWSFVTNFDCAEGVVRIYNKMVLDCNNDISMSSLSYSYYKIKDLNKIEKHLDKLFNDYRNCLKKQKKYKIQQKIDKIKDMF